ncbi:MAG: endo alpha-1,4 polygalactosaminidase [Gammaproteobacteria bacterium]|nr:endo alpha-1,4 polygalactosaminidase [Gammaproteobacteria bacterium]
MARLPALLLVLVSPLAGADGGDIAPWAASPPCSIGYVLQADRLSPNRLAAVDLLARSGRDVLVLDRAYGGGDARWSIPELESMRYAAPGRSVVSYLSIGEAEDYRPYWQAGWRFDGAGRPSAATPDFIVAPNPDWPGNYKVRYWDERWQQLVLADLDDLLEQEFDGVYLDIVDAFQYFEQDPVSDTWQALRINPETGRSYREDMVRWVVAIAAHARRRRPGFVVVPQNGSALLAFPEYAAAVDGIAVEDLYTLGDEPQAATHTATVESDLKPLIDAGKPVFVVEYAADAALRERARSAAAARGHLLLFADRALTGLGTAAPPPRCARAAR